MKWRGSKDKTLLGAGDPPAVEVLRAGAPSPFFLTCEHAGKVLPRRLGTLGLEPWHLERHIAYDIGAASVARGLSERLDAHVVLQAYSRLVVDCNRSPDAEDFVVKVSEDTAILGNLDVGEALRCAEGCAVGWLPAGAALTWPAH